jgi:hypothetical protein
MQPDPIAKLLTHAAPFCPTTRAVLVAMRRMAALGLFEAGASMMMMQQFGLHFRKVLVLLRAYVMQASQGADHAIRIAPCCAPRMTQDEAALLGVITLALQDPARASAYAQSLSQPHAAASLLATAQVLAGAIADSGRRLVQVGE